MNPRVNNLLQLYAYNEAKQNKTKWKKKYNSKKEKTTPTVSKAVNFYHLLKLFKQRQPIRSKTFN